MYIVCFPAAVVVVVGRVSIEANQHTGVSLSASTSETLFFFFFVTQTPEGGR